MKLNGYLERLKNLIHQKKESKKIKEKIFGQICQYQHHHRPQQPESQLSQSQRSQTQVNNTHDYYEIDDGFQSIFGSNNNTNMYHGTSGLLYK